MADDVVAPPVAGVATVVAPVAAALAVLMSTSGMGFPRRV